MIKTTPEQERRMLEHLLELPDGAPLQDIMQRIILMLDAARSAIKDSDRMDWLEKRRVALNKHYGTDYGWKFIANHNVTRLFVKDVPTIDLHDSEARGPDIRKAIDDAMQRSRMGLPNA